MNQDKGKAAAATPAEESGCSRRHAIVMTDEQVEVLRKQISIFATICDQLIEMHDGHAAHQGSIAGVMPGNMYCDPLMVHGGKSFTARQRWTPTKIQLRILESNFGEGNGKLPDRQKIQDVTAELSQHGQISVTNVYNWIQNRRARTKKKNLKRKQAASPPNNAESDAQAGSSSSK